MKTQIRKERLKQLEVKSIVEAQKEYPNLIYIGLSTWQRFDHIYKIYLDDEFAGVCAVNTLGKYAKIGPFVLLPHMHGKSLGKALIHHILEDFKDDNYVYISSSNPAVWHIVESAGFIQYEYLFQIPFQIWIIY